jgi:23S rRNA pseudoU1915 N3-methylase RlmH
MPKEVAMVLQGLCSSQLSLLRQECLCLAISVPLTISHSLGHILLTENVYIKVRIVVLIIFTTRRRVDAA